MCNLKISHIHQSNNDKEKLYTKLDSTNMIFSQILMPLRIMLIHKTKQTKTGHKTTNH